MVSTYHLIKLLQNASRVPNPKKNKKPDTIKIKNVTPAPKVIFKTCRICLQQGMIPIFRKTNSYNFPLSHYLKIICGIDLTANDIFPQYLCKPCFDTLDAAIKLRNTAKQSQIKLKAVSSSHQNISSYNETGGEYKYEVPILSSQQKKEALSKEIKREKNSSEQTKYNPKVPPPQLQKDIKSKDEDQYEKYFRKISTNENKPAYQCRICKKNYKKLSRADHLITHLPDSAFQYVCEVCGKTFKKSCSFHQHKKIHRDVLPFKCNLCPYKGRHKEQLKGHVKRMHFKEYNYQCTQCPKKFFEGNSYRRHLVRHGKPMFKCTICDKSFYENSMLKEHNATNHMGDAHTLHKCDICGNSYKRRKNLLVHQIKAHKRKKVFNNRANYLKLENKTVANEIQ